MICAKCGKSLPRAEKRAWVIIDGKPCVVCRECASSLLGDVTPSTISLKGKN